VRASCRRPKVINASGCTRDLSFVDQMAMFTDTAYARMVLTKDTSHPQAVARDFYRKGIFGRVEGQSILYETLLKRFG
jgi:hypothetical protein